MFIRSLSLLAMAEAAVRDIHMIPNPEWEKDIFPVHSSYEHMLIFATKQRNIDLLEAQLLDVSTPNSENYGKYWSYSQIGEFTSNVEGCAEIAKWLRIKEVEVLWTSKHCDYIKARTTVTRWASLFNAVFYEYQHKSGEKMVRAPSATIPSELDTHLHTVFYLFDSESPPSKKSHIMSVDSHTNIHKIVESSPEEFSASSSKASVDVPFLDNLYQIPSNIGHNFSTQLVYESGTQKWSPTDLDTFQSIYGLTKQMPIQVAGENTSFCTFDTCGEANLDLQYIMGVSQVFMGYINLDRK